MEDQKMVPQVPLTLYWVGHRVLMEPRIYTWHSEIREDSPGVDPVFNMSIMERGALKGILLHILKRIEEAENRG